MCVRRFPRRAWCLVQRQAFYVRLDDCWSLVRARSPPL